LYHIADSVSHFITNRRDGEDLAPELWPILEGLEAMRAESLKKTPMAMLSRVVVGTHGKCLIINLPGSPKAVRECLEAILLVLPHAMATLKGQAGECGVV
jgi:hypothetical protein